jgi:transcriptional adapter 3
LEPIIVDEDRNNGGRSSDAYLPLEMTIEEILDREGSPSTLPSVAALKAMQETIQTKVLPHVAKRGVISDRLLREVSKRRTLRD